MAAGKFDIPPQLGSPKVLEYMRGQIAGGAVFRGGLKKGSGTTVTVTVRRTASTVNSISNFVPREEHSRATLASAIIFFNVGDQVVDVALPACLPPR